MIREPDGELDETARIVGEAASEVHRTLGPGFFESVYEEAMAIELGVRGVAFDRQVAVRLNYKHVSIGDVRIDLLVERRLVVELKAVDSLVPIHVAQVISYLKATQLHLGVLVNFNVRFLGQGIRRVILTP